MKRIIIILLAGVAAVAVAVIQHRRLAEIRAEGDNLKQAAEGTGGGHRKAAAGTSTVKGVTEEVVNEVHETFVEGVIAFRDRSGGRDPAKAERAKRMMLAAKDFSPENIASLVDALRADPRLEGMKEDELVENCLKFIKRVAPRALLAYLETHRDLPNWQGWFDSCYRKCLVVAPKLAIKHFEEEAGKGNSDFETTSSRRSVMLALAASDPDRMLAMAMSPELAADPDALTHLGGFVDDKLETATDHHRFMAALRRAAKKHPDSELLATVRKDYVRAMSSSLPTWPVEEMVALVDGEFEPEERLLVAEKASHRVDLDDNAKWADWFLGIDPKDWDQWIVGQPQQFEHPVIERLVDWGWGDPTAAAAWLEKVPPGALRSATVLKFAWTIAGRNPDAAESYLSEIPDSKEKRNIVKKIAKARQSD